MSAPLPPYKINVFERAKGFESPMLHDFTIVKKVRKNAEIPVKGMLHFFAVIMNVRSSYRTQFFRKKCDF